MNDMVIMPPETDRQKFLGGSDVASIYGVSPWRTPLQLWEDKIKPRSEDENPERKKFFARRKRQEPVIAEMLADEYGIEVVRLSLDDHPNRYTDSEYPFLAAEIDFEFLMSQSVRDAFPDRPEFCEIPDGTLLNGEIKTVHPFKASEWGEQGSEDVPIYYAAQVMHGLGVAPGKRPAAIVAALFGLDTLLCFPIMRDEETIAAMREKAVEFWTVNVMQRKPPAMVNVDDVKRFYAGFNGKPVDLSSEAFEALSGLDQIRKQRSQLDQDEQELQWRIARSVAFNWGTDIEADAKNKPAIETKENALLMYEGKQVGSWNRQRGSFLDQKRLAAEHPDIVRAYKVEHFFRVFRTKKTK